MQIRNSSYIILNEARSQKSIKASINSISQAQNRYYETEEKSADLEKSDDFFQSQSEKSREQRDRGRKSWRQRRIVMCEHSAWVCRLASRV